MLRKKNEQIGKLRDLIKDHIENSKVIDTIKDYIANDKSLTIDDKNAIIHKLKTEGILSHILRSIPVTKISPDKKVVAGINVKKSTGRDIPHKDLLDKNKKYVVCKISRGASFVDFVSPKEDEYLKV